MSTERDTSKYWTPEKEAHFQRLLESARGSAEERLCIALAIKFGLRLDELPRVSRGNIKGDSILVHTVL